MSKKEPIKSAADKPKIDANTARKLWAQNPTDWVSLFTQSTGRGPADFHESGGAIKLHCPFHSDSNPSGIFHVKNRYFKCRSCNTYTSDPIKVLALVTGTHYGDALGLYRSHFSSVDKTVDIEELGKNDLLQHRLRLLSECFHEQLLSVWQNDTEVKITTPQIRKSLEWLKHRGVENPEHHTSLGIFPRSTDLQNLLRQIQAAGRIRVTEEDIAACTALTALDNSAAYVGCVVYAYATAPGFVTRFKLRISDDKDSIRWVPEVAPYPDTPGAFGVDTAAYWPYYANEQTTRFVAVEGEHDQIRLFQGQGAEVNEIVIALSGSGHAGVDFMRDLGFKTCRLVPDRDAAGASYPIEVLKKSREVQIEIFKWPDTLHDPALSKVDPDEAVKRFGFDQTFSEIAKADNYEQAWRWCLNRALVELQGVSKDNLPAQKDIAVKYALYLHDETERTHFSKKFLESCPALPEETVTRAAAAAVQTPRGFANRIVDWLLGRLQPLKYTPNNGELILWSFASSSKLTVTVDADTQVSRFLHVLSGKGDLYEFARSEIGIPADYPDPDAPNAPESALYNAERLVERSLKRAVRQLAARANLDVDIDNGRGQGVHLAMAPKTGFGYIVNGKKMYRLEWDEKKERLIRVENIKSPLQGKVFLDAGTKRGIDMETGWTALLKTPDDLLRQPPYTLEETYDMVRNVFAKAFTFQKQESNVLYATALVFYNYLYDIIDSRRVMTHLAAEANSGKTTFMSVTSNSLTSNTVPNRKYSLCDHGYSLDNFTTAGFYQTFTGMRLVAAIDEMNDPNDKTEASHGIQDFYKGLRSLALSGTTFNVKGSLNREGYHYSISNTMITAGSSRLYNEMDSSRFNTLKLIQRKEFNAENVFQTLYTDAEWTKLRESVLLHSLNMAMKVWQVHEEIERGNWSGPTQLDPAKYDRRARNLLPLAAVMQVLGQDGAKFMKTFVEAMDEEKEQRNEETLGHGLLDAVLAISIRTNDRGDSDGPITTIKNLLLENNYSRLNNLRIGVYYDIDTGYLVFDWKTMRMAMNATQSIPENVMQCTDAMNSLGDMLISYELARSSSVDLKARAQGIRNIRQASVINIKKYLLDGANVAKDQLGLVGQQDMRAPHPADTSNNIDFG